MYRGFFIIAAVMVLAGCASGQLKRAEQYAEQKDWDKAVIAYRAAHEERPGDIEIKSALARTELHAAEFYYERGTALVARGDYDGAIKSFEQGLVAMPEHAKLLAAIRDVTIKKEVARMAMEAERYSQVGDLERAGRLLERALELAPGDVRLTVQLESVRERAGQNKPEEFALASQRPVTLNFKAAELKSAFEFLAKSFGINVIFDEDVKDKEVTLFAQNVPFRQALELMLTTTQTFYKKVGPNTLIIAPDTKDKRGQYEDYVIRTFPLTNASAKEMADVLKGVMTLQKLVVNESLNTLTLRDKPEAIALAADLIRANDLRLAEIVLDVEILEVNKTKADKLGFDYGSTMTITFPPYQFTDSIGNTLEQGTLTLPTVTFHYFKQNVNAKTLANPKIRVVNGREAKIHIGDRVPLRSSTIQDATGQTRTTFEYNDIGIRLVVTPQINVDNSSLVKMSLEVSTLGQNLGTQTEPAYSIGTRNAQTSMLLRDGETAILGGLIRDEDRRARVKVPGLGDIPVAGALFTSLDDSLTRTDVLLTITPRIIRPWELAPESTRNLYSGTAEHYTTRARLGTDEMVETVMSAAREEALRNHRLQAVRAEPPTLAFDADNYGVKTGEEITVGLRANNPGEYGEGLRVRLEYEPDSLEFVRMAQPQSGQVEADGNGALMARFDANSNGGGDVSGSLIFRALKPGVSRLELAEMADANAAQARLRHSSAYVQVVD